MMGDNTTKSYNIEKSLSLVNKLVEHKCNINQRTNLTENLIHMEQINSLYVKHWLAKCYEIDIKNTDPINKHDHDHEQQLQKLPENSTVIVQSYTTPGAA